MVGSGLVYARFRVGARHFGCWPCSRPYSLPHCLGKVRSIGIPDWRSVVGTFRGTLGRGPPTSGTWRTWSESLLRRLYAWVSMRTKGPSTQRYLAGSKGVVTSCYIRLLVIVGFADTGHMQRSSKQHRS